VRDYLPLPGLVAQDLQAQLKKNLNIDASLNPVDADTFQQLASSGKLPGLFLLGWGADYPDITNFLDYHFGASADEAFGKKYVDLAAVLNQAAALNGDEARKPLYEQANNLVRQHVPVVPVAHSGSATAWKASVDGAHSSPLGAEQLALASIPGKATFIWMQSAEPLSLYCADETDGESLRACGQVTEPLYQFEPGGASARPNLAKACQPNADLTEWTCSLQEGVKFSDGSDLDANDVVETYVAQWDAASPLHKGNTGAFDYWASLWGAFLNAPPK
jgi:peptide/nickel transport system substrate-binding protein